MRGFLFSSLPLARTHPNSLVGRHQHSRPCDCHVDHHARRCDRLQDLYIDRHSARFDLYRRQVCRYRFVLFLSFSESRTKPPISCRKRCLHYLPPRSSFPVSPFYLTAHPFHLRSSQVYPVTCCPNTYVQLTPRPSAKRRFARSFGKTQHEFAKRAVVTTTETQTETRTVEGTQTLPGKAVTVTETVTTTEEQPASTTTFVLFSFLCPFFLHSD